MLDVSAPAEARDHPDNSVPGRGFACAFAGCSGFMHPAGAPTGVVLCAPWGLEDLVIRKSWRLLAEAIAAAGYPCLRFDYPGTGNSLGRAVEVTSLDVWVAAIGAAADHMRRINGVRRFVFVGLRLGAALAVEAARRRGDVVGLHLIAPVVDGHRHARDLAAAGRTAGSHNGRGGCLSVAGFLAPAPLLDSLAAIDLRAIDRLDGPGVTIYDRMDRQDLAEAVEHMRGLGIDLCVDAGVCEPIRPDGIAQPLPVAPERLIARIRAAHPVVLPSPTREPLLTSVLQGDLFREEPIRFGADQSLFGISCHPLRERDGVPVFVLLNQDNVPLIGRGRGAVDLARDLAAAGIPSLRIDAAGIGESRDDLARPRDLVYSDRLLADVFAAVDMLSACGHTRVALTGAGSGAYLALAAAQADPRVTEVIAIDAQRLVWDPKERAEDVVAFASRTLAFYLAAARRPGVVGQLIRRRHRILPALTFLVRRGTKILLARAPRRLRPILRRGSMDAYLARFFATFAARGTRVSLVYGAGDPGLTELHTYFGPDGRDLRLPNVTVAVVRSPGLDPTVSGWLRGHLVRLAEEPSPHAASGVAGHKRAA